MVGLQISHYYPLERIEVLSKKFSGLKEDSIRDFIEFYEKIVVKLPENNFTKKNTSVPSWRKKHKCNSRDMSKYLKNAWKPSVPANDEEKIKREIISHLNKLNEKKFTIITKEFIDSLEKAFYVDTYNLLIDELFKKFDSDKKYLRIYAKLIYELSVNKKWQKNMFSITSNEKDFYWTENNLSDLSETVDKSEKSYFGPFDSKIDALNDAVSKNNFETRFIKRLEIRFRQRDVYYYQIINDSRSDFELYNFSKNKFINFLEIIFNLYNIQYIHEGIILHCLIQLLNSYEETKYDESLEGFIHLYKLYKRNGSYSITHKNHTYFNNLIQKLNEEHTICIRLKFFLSSLFDIEIGEISSAVIESMNITEVSNTSIVEEEEKIIMENITCVVEEFSSHQCYEGCKDLLSEIPSTYDDKLVESCIQKLITSNQNNTPMCLKLLQLLLEKRKNCNKEINSVIFDILKDYSELKIDYPIIKSNLKLLFDFIKTTNSELFDDISKQTLSQETIEELSEDFETIFNFSKDQLA